MFFRWYRCKIAQRVADKMAYMGTCPNERDIILPFTSLRQRIMFAMSSIVVRIAGSLIVNAIIVRGELYERRMGLPSLR